MEEQSFFLRVIAPYINFSIFLFLAIKLFKQPILDMLKGRKSAFEQSVIKATEAKNSAIAAKAELDKKLSQLESEIQSIVSDARRAAENEARMIIESAKELAAHIEQESVRLANARLKAANEQLKLELLSQINAQVEQKLKSDLSSSQHKTIVGNNLKLLSTFKGR